MKVLFDHSDRFFLAHGGFQVQIEGTKAGLEASGIHVEFARWWDAAQTADLVHFFGRPSEIYVELAHKKNLKVVISELLTELGSRSAATRTLQKAITSAAQTLLPKVFIQRMAWESFKLADAVVAGTEWEAYLFTKMFGADPMNVACIGNGVEQVFTNSTPRPRDQWLVCTASITERKRVLELAQAAVQARTPVWIIGKPYSDKDSYAQMFLAFARKHPEYVRYEGPIEDRGQLARAYRQARGFVLLSSMESLSLAAGEAAACECPLLLSDLPWARSAFPRGASFCPVVPPHRMAPFLRAFHDAAPAMPLPEKPKSWVEIGAELELLYRRLLKTSR